MKKVLIVGLTLFGFTMAKAQDDSDKKFRFGLKVMPSINWLKVNDEKRFSKGGSAMKFGYGLMTEFKLAGAAWFSTGFQIEYDGGKVNYIDSTFYFHDDNKGFLEAEDIDFSNNSTSGYNTYMLTKRTFKSTYLTFPVLLRLKTQEIGYITYYGNIGLLASIHLKSKSDDEVLDWNNGNGNGFNPNKKTNEDMNISKDMGLAKFGFTIGGGAEMNLSGSTSLIFGLNWNQGFTNYVKGDSKYNVDGPKTGDRSDAKATRLDQKFVTNNLSLTLGVLF